MKKIFSILLLCAAPFVYANDAPVFEETDECIQRGAYAPFSIGGSTCDDSDRLGSENYQGCSDLGDQCDGCECDGCDCNPCNCDPCDCDKCSEEDACGGCETCEECDACDEYEVYYEDSVDAQDGAELLPLTHTRKAKSC